MLSIVIDVRSTEQMGDVLIAGNCWINEVAKVIQTTAPRSDESMILNPVKMFP
jgi:hypothetical protein